MSSLTARLVKVGGSLFDFGGLPVELRRWLDAQKPAANVLLAGGGDFANIIRRADQTFGIGQAPAHRLCVEAMSVSAWLLSALIPEATLTTCFDDLRRAGTSARTKLLVFDARDFLQDIEPDLGGVPIPHTWAVTSDSIAARLAEVLAVEELVLLKSCQPLAGATRLSAAAAGYVDKYFPVAARSISRVRCVDLRDPAHAEAELS